MPIPNNQFFTDFLTNVVIIFYFQKKVKKIMKKGDDLDSEQNLIRTVQKHY